MKGKTQYDFERWYLKDYIYKHREDYIRFGDANVLRKFYRLQDSCKFGVMQDYYDSCGIDVDVWKYYNTDGEPDGDYEWQVKCYKWNRYHSNFENTRPQARAKALEKAEEIREEQLNK